MRDILLPKEELFSFVKRTRRKLRIFLVRSSEVRWYLLIRRRRASNRCSKDKSKKISSCRERMTLDNPIFTSIELRIVFVSFHRLVSPGISLSLSLIFWLTFVSISVPCRSLFDVCQDDLKWNSSRIDHVSLLRSVHVFQSFCGWRWLKRDFSFTNNLFRSEDRDELKRLTSISTKIYLLLFCSLVIKLINRSSVYFPTRRSRRNSFYPRTGEA